MNRIKGPILSFVGLITMFAMVLCAVPTAFAVPAKRADVAVVVEGLHSPRGLAMGPGNILYVAQAGDAANAGSIIQIKNAMSQNATYQTIIDGIPSLGGGGEFIGVGGISVLGRGTNTGIYAIMNESPQGTGNGAFGNLLRISLDGTSNTITNVGFLDYQWTLLHHDLWMEFPDSNPYGVLAIPGHIYIADAGANTLNEVMPDGSVRVLAYFPNERIRDAIPTCVTQGPDGALYVGTLALVDTFVFGPSAKVYRVDPSQANLADPTATPMTRWATGLWPINGCSFGSDGNFYASQLFTVPHFGPHFGDPTVNPHGDVVKIPFSSPSTHTFLTNGALSYTAGVAVGSSGDVFVADGTFSVPNGRVLRINQ